MGYITQLPSRGEVAWCHKKEFTVRNPSHLPYINHSMEPRVPPTTTKTTWRLVLSSWMRGVHLWPEGDIFSKWIFSAFHVSFRRYCDIAGFGWVEWCKKAMYLLRFMKCKCWGFHHPAVGQFKLLDWSCVPGLVGTVQVEDLTLI